MRPRKRIRYDLYLGDEEVRRNVSTDQPLEPEDLLFEIRWLVTHVLPATEDRIDYEAYARRVMPGEVVRPRMAYLVVKRGSAAATMGSYTTRRPLNVGTEIVLDLEKWIICEVRSKGAHELVSAVVVVEQR